MNPSSLDWSIQSALSSLFPPFEATAPTVLSQLFRTIEERYHGDALHCLLDFLIPAKHILESVQQAACAAYSDVLFRCEGWPLCLRDRVVIQLAPINPLLLRPGDFYLQVEPFGEQAARIILKSLLVQGEGLVDQQQAGGFGSQLSLESGVGLGVEETPIPETSYPCIFTQAWLEEVNEGRHGAPLRTCVLSSDQGVVKVPWSEIINPEFLDRPKSTIHSAPFMTDAMLAQGVFPPPSSSSSSSTLPLPTGAAQSSVQSDLSPLTMETVILPAKDGIAVSLRLTGGNHKLVKADQHHRVHHHHQHHSQGSALSNPSGKPVGWVAPNTWDTRHNREMEGEYVDLVEFNKEKEALALAALSKLPPPPPAPPVTPKPSQKGVRPVRPAPPAPAPAPKRDNHTTTPAVQLQGGCSPKLPAELLGSPCSSKGPIIPLTLELEAKNRHRESYLAALMNPVTFEGTLAPLEESGTDGEELGGGLGAGECEAVLGHTQPTPKQPTSHHHPSSSPLASLNEREGGGGGGSSPCLLRHLGPTGRPCVNVNCGCPNKCTGASPGQAQQALQYTHQHQPTFCGQSQDDLQKGHSGGQKFPKTQMLHKLGQQCKPHATGTGLGLGMSLASQGQTQTELEGAHPNNHHSQHPHHHHQTPLVAQDPCLAKHPRAPLQSQAPQQAPWPLTSSPTKTPPLRRMPVTTAGLCPSGPAAGAAGAGGAGGVGNGGVTAITGGLGAMALAEILRGGGGGGWAKGRTKQHSLSSVSDSAQECLQAQAQAQAHAQAQGRTPGGRSLSDICPEIIPTVRVIQNKKTTAFGLVSPKLDRKAQSKQAKKDPGTPQAPAGGLDRLLQTSGDQQPAGAQGRQPVPGPRVPVCPLFKPYSPDSITLLPLAIACLPGSRDRAGRAVLEVHGERRGWTCPLVTSVELCKLLLYLHSLPRKEIRDLGLTLVVDSRRSPAPPVFYKSLLMLQEQALHAVHGIVVLVDKDGNSRPERHTGLQMDVVTSLKALHKIVDGQQLTSDLGGTFLYNHSDWLHFHQKMAVFMTDLQGASTLLQKAIKKLDSVRKMDTVTDVKVCIEEQRSSMKEVLEDTRLVTLQREGGAILARMRKEEFRFAQSEDYRDSMEVMRSLYNQVEERVHMLVMRSNQSLQHLDHLLQLRTMEDNITTIREWFSSQEQSWRREEMLKEVNSSEDTLERVEQRLTRLTSFLGQAKEKKAQADALVREAERIQRASFPEADVFRALVNTLQTDLAESLSRAQQSHTQLETTARLYRFCEQALSLAMEVGQYLEQAGSGCYPGQQRGNSATLRAFEERLRAGFSPERFQQAKEEALALGSPAGMRRWGTAWARCQDVSQRLHRRLQTASSSSSSSSSPPPSTPSSKDHSPKQVSPKGGEKGDGGEKGVERPVGETVTTAADGTTNTASATAVSSAQSPTANEEMVAASEAPTLQFKESDRKGGGGGGGGGGASVGATESRDSRARRLQDEEVTITCFNLHFNKMDGKGRKASIGGGSGNGCGSGGGLAPPLSPKHTVEDCSDVSSSAQPQSPTTTNTGATESQCRASPPLSPLTSQSEAAPRSSPATAPSSPTKASVAPSFASLPDEIEGKVSTSTLPPLSPLLLPPASSGAQAPHLPWAAAAAVGKASKPKPLPKPSRWWRGVAQRGEHRSSHSQSEDDLRRMEEPAHHHHHPPACHRALGRSHSEGSCASLCVGVNTGSGCGSGSGAQRGSSFYTRHTDATSAGGVFGSRSSSASTSSSIPPQHHQYSHHPYHQHHPLLHLSSSTPHHLGQPGQSTPTPYRRRGSEDHRGGGGGGGWMEELHCSRLEAQNGSASAGPSTDAAAVMACGLQTPKLGRMAQADTSAGNGSNNLKLQRIMEELLLTEREYVRALGYVMEHYFPQLERPDVPQDLRGQRGSIFGNLEKLRDFHQHHFLQELEQCLREPFHVGHCFLKHKESFSLYALYSKNKPRSDNLLKHHGHFFKQKQLELGDKMDLSSYLLKPVQRISKYSLLLQDMARECGPEPLPGAASASSSSASPSASAPAASSSSSSAAAAAALAARSHQRSQIQAALEVIHFQLRHGNNLLAMDDIQDCDVNLKEQGQLIRQDEFLVSFRKKKCYRHIFLFQDLILFSKTKKTEVGNDVYVYKQSFKTSDIGMTHNCGESGLCFEIWFRRRKSQDTYTLQAASAEVKRGWTRDLERILWEQAIHNREVRMQERVFMGIGYKPFMDIQPSEAAISDRAINCAPGSRECKASGVPGSSPGRFPALRPNSVRRTSSSGSHSSSSSSSSGRGSMSPVGGYLCPIGGPPAMGHGGLALPLSLPLSTPGVMEEDDLDPEQRNHHVLVDSSESSGESVSGFSSSGCSCLSVIGGEVEDSGSSEGPSEVSPKAQTAALTQRGPQEPTDGPSSSVALAPTQTPLVSPSLASPLPTPTLLPPPPLAPVLAPAAMSRIRDHPLGKVSEMNLTGKSTEV